MKFNEIWRFTLVFMTEKSLTEKMKTFVFRRKTFEKCRRTLESGSERKKRKYRMKIKLSCDKYILIKYI